MKLYLNLICQSKKSSTLFCPENVKHTSIIFDINNFPWKHSKARLDSSGSCLTS